MKTSNRQSGSAHVVIIIVLILVILGLLGFVFWQNFMQTKSTNNVTATTSATDPYSGWNTYTDSSYGFTLRYPSDWTTGTVQGGANSSVKSITLDPPASTTSTTSSVDGTGHEVTVSTQAASTVSLATGDVMGSVYALKQDQAGKDTSGIYAKKYTDTINAIPVTEFDMLSQQPYFAAVFAHGDGYVEIGFMQTPTKADLSATMNKILASLKLT